MLILAVFYSSTPKSPKTIQPIRNHPSAAHGPRFITRIIRMMAKKQPITYFYLRRKAQSKEKITRNNKDNCPSDPSSLEVETNIANTNKPRETSVMLDNVLLVIESILP